MVIEQRELKEEITGNVEHLVNMKNIMGNTLEELSIYIGTFSNSVIAFSRQCSMNRTFG